MFFLKLLIKIIFMKFSILSKNLQLFLNVVETILIDVSSFRTTRTFLNNAIVNSLIISSIFKSTLTTLITMKKFNFFHFKRFFFEFKNKFINEISNIILNQFIRKYQYMNNEIYNFKQILYDKKSNKIFNV